MPGGSDRQLRILLLDTKHENPNHYIVLGIKAALAAHPRVAAVKLVGYADLIGEARKADFDICLAVDGEAIAFDILVRVRPLVKRMVLWTFDDPYERDRTIPLASLFDLVFTNDEGSVTAYPDNTFHLPLAASPDQEVRSIPSNNSQYKYDISFIGSAWPNRVQFLRKLMRVMPDLKHRFVLHYNEFLPASYLDLPDSSYVGSVSHHDFAEISNQSRINLTLHREFSGDGLNPCASTPGPRLFEVGLAGGYQLIDINETPVDKYYKAGLEVDVFNNFNDCIDLIRDRLANPKKRIEMARAAQRHTRAQHLYANRVREIFERLDALPDENPAVASTRAPHKPRLLFVTHNTIANGNFGGVEVYQETVANELRNEYEIFYYRPNPQAKKLGVLEFILTDDRHRPLHRVHAPEMDFVRIMSQPVIEGAFSRLLVDYEIELIHYHHLIHHPITLPLISRLQGIPSVFTTHDFYIVCSRFNLLNARNEYCDIANHPLSLCDNCLSSGEGVPDGSQAYRRYLAREVIKAFDHVIANTPSAQRVFSSVYPELAEGDSLTQLGPSLPNVTPFVPSARKETKREIEGAKARPLRVVFFGNFSRIKGADDFLAAAGMLCDSNIKFTICGRIDAEYHPVLKDLKLQNVEVRGAFSPGELDLTEFDVALIISIWPETYCITLSEAWRAGVVPIATQIGALADRIKPNVNGFTVPPHGIGEIVELLQQMEADRSLLDDIRANITPDLWLTPEQHCNALRDIYARLLNAHPTARPAGGGWRSPNLPPVDIRLANVKLNSPNWTTPADVPGPPLPSPLRPHMNPLWNSFRALKKEFSDGRVSVDTSHFLHVDHIIHDGQPLGDSRLQPLKLPPARTGLSLVGWLQSSSLDACDDIRLLARSANGDMIQRRVTLNERSDLLQAFPGQACTGYATEPLPVEMLDSGVYSLELSLVRHGRRVLFPFPLALICSKFGVLLIPTTAGQTTQIQVGVPLIEGPSESRKMHIPRGVVVVDELSVKASNAFGNPLGSTSKVTLQPERLHVSGWFNRLELPQDIESAYIFLRGPENYKMAAGPTPRPDVAEHFGVEGMRQSGFEANIWLPGLPQGRYEVFFGLKGLGVFYEVESPLDALEIDADGGAALGSEPVTDTAPALAPIINRTTKKRKPRAKPPILEAKSKDEASI